MMVEGKARLLLISYHFPPMESAGAVRWESMVRHAERFGYAVDVVTVLPDWWREGMASPRVDRLPEGTGVTGVSVAALWSEVLEARLHEWWLRFRSEAHRPRKNSSNSGSSSSPLREGRDPVSQQHSLAPHECHWFRSRRDLLRHWWVLQEHRRDLSWAKAAGKVAREIFRPGVHRTLITCGPPHEVHLTGSRLARRVGLPHVMDLRDPWALPVRTPEHLGSPLRWVMARRAEQEAVGHAAMVVANTEPLRKAMIEAHPGTGARFITVMNGWDDDEELPVMAPQMPGDPFRVLYTGEVYLDRNPDGFFRASRKVIADLGLAPDSFEIVFIGPSGSGADKVRTIAAREGIESFVTVRPRVPREEVLREMARATMLLSLGQDSPYAVPSKVFEYLRFAAWNLVLAAPESPTGTLLACTGVDLADPRDETAVGAVLKRRIAEHMAGARASAVGGVGRFARSVQADALFSELSRLRLSLVDG